MRYIQTQTSFSAGQLGRTLEGRTDITEYHNGCRELDNFMVMKAGGIEKVVGSDAVFASGGTKGDDKHFIFTDPKTGETYVLVILLTQANIVYSFVYREDMQSTKSVLPSTTLALNYGTAVTSTEGFSFAQFEKWGFLTHDSGDFEPTIFTIDEAGDIHHSVIGSTGEFNDPWTYFGGWYKTPLQAVLNLDISINVTNATNPNDVRLSLNGGLITDYVGVNDVLAVNGVYKIDTESYYTLAYFKVNNTLNTNLISCRAATTVLGSAAPRDGTYEIWYYPQFGNKNGWPKKVANYESRLVLGGSREKSMTLYGSAINNPFFYNNVRAKYSSNITTDDAYSGSIQNTDPYIFTVASKAGATIKFLEGGESLSIGTDDTIIAGSGLDGGLLGPLNVSFRHLYKVPADGPVVVIDKGLYLSASGGKQLHSFTFNTSNGSSQGKDISILSPDIYEGKAKVLAYDTSVGVLAVVKQDGSAHLVTVTHESQVLAHAKLNFDEAIELSDVIYVPSSKKLVFYGNYVGGEQAYFVYDMNKEEDMHESERYTTARTTILFPSAGNTFVADKFPAGTELVVLTYDDLGELRDVMPKLVSDASKVVTLPYNIIAGDTQLVYGLAVKSSVQLMPVEAGANLGSAQYGMKRIDSVTARVYKSNSLKLKEFSSKHWEEKILVESDATEGYTGLHEVKLSSDPSREQVVCVTNDRPEALTILSLTLRGQSNDA